MCVLATVVGCSPFTTLTVLEGRGAGGAGDARRRLLTRGSAHTPLRPYLTWVSRRLLGTTGGSWRHLPSAGHGMELGTKQKSELILQLIS